MSVSLSISETEFVDEVRTALGGLDEDVISNDMILQQKKRFVIPELENKLKGKNLSGEEQKVDTAIIALTAEKSFKTWVKKSQVTSGQTSMSISVESHKEDLEHQTAEALSQLGLSETPGAVGTPFVDSSDGFL